jgi:3-(3-hydroxy-phenyl)propionate hydroxylase
VAHRGAIGRLDDVVGRGWTLLSAAGSPAPLTAAQQALLTGIGGTAVTVGPAGSGADVVDVEGTYTGWMARNGVAHLLVRPDFYVAATAADGAGIQAAFDRVVGPLVSAVSVAAG